MCLTVHEHVYAQFPRAKWSISNYFTARQSASNRNGRPARSQRGWGPARWGCSLLRLAGSWVNSSLMASPTGDLMIKDDARRHGKKRWTAGRKWVINGSGGIKNKWLICYWLDDSFFFLNQSNRWFVSSRDQKATNNGGSTSGGTLTWPFPPLDPSRVHTSGHASLPLQPHVLMVPYHYPFLVLCRDESATGQFHYRKK